MGNNKEWKKTSRIKRADLETKLEKGPGEREKTARIERAEPGIKTGKELALVKVVIIILLIAILSTIVGGWRRSVAIQALIKEEKLSGRKRLVALKEEMEAAPDNLAERIPILRKKILTVEEENGRLEKELKAEQERNSSLKRRQAGLRGRSKGFEEEKALPDPVLEEIKEIKEKTTAARDEKEDKEELRDEMREREYKECQEAIAKAAETRKDTWLWIFITSHPRSIYCAAAMFARAELLYEDGQPERARSKYRMVIRGYPNSTYASLAKSRIGDIKAHQRYGGGGAGAVKIEPSYWKGSK